MMTSATFVMAEMVQLLRQGLDWSLVGEEVPEEIGSSH